MSEDRSSDVHRNHHRDQHCNDAPVVLDRPDSDQQPGDPELTEIIDHDVPGQHQFGPVVERTDEVVDAGLERVRGNPIVDRVFTVASALGDFSMIWHAINLALGLTRRHGSARNRVVTFAVLIGLESLVVNQGVKRLFKRTRPTVAGDSRLRVRHPRTSSFPSGHASAATFAASLLGPRATRPASSLIYAAASIVATSRAYVRIHHASDVIAGVVTGGLLAVTTKYLMRRLGLAHLL